MFLVSQLGLKVQIYDYSLLTLSVETSWGIKQLEYSILILKTYGINYMDFRSPGKYAYGTPWGSFVEWREHPALAYVECDEFTRKLLLINDSFPNLMVIKKG